MRVFLAIGLTFGVWACKTTEQGPTASSSLRETAESGSRDSLTEAYKMTRLTQNEPIEAGKANEYQVALKQGDGFYFGTQSIGAFNRTVKTAIRLTGPDGKVLKSAVSRFEDTDDGQGGDSSDFSGWSTEVRLDPVPATGNYLVTVTSSAETQGAFSSSGSGDFQLVIWERKTGSGGSAVTVAFDGPVLTNGRKHSVKAVESIPVGVPGEYSFGEEEVCIEWQTDVDLSPGCLRSEKQNLHTVAWSATIQWTVTDGDGSTSEFTTKAKVGVKAQALAGKLPFVYLDGPAGLTYKLGDELRRIEIDQHADEEVLISGAGEGEAFVVKEVHAPATARASIGKAGEVRAENPDSLLAFLLWAPEIRWTK